MTKINKVVMMQQLDFLLSVSKNILQFEVLYQFAVLLVYLPSCLDQETAK